MSAHLLNQSWLPAIVLTSVLGLLGCGPEPVEPPEGCEADPRLTPWVQDSERPGVSGHFTLRMLEAQPAPAQKGDNTWKVRVTDAAGAAVTGATVKVTPFMPEHGHGTSIAATVTEDADGRYDITPVNLSMPGLWEVTFDVKSAQGTADRMVVWLCIEG